MQKHSISTPNVKRDITKMSFMTSNIGASQRLIITIQHLSTIQMTVEQFYQLSKYTIGQHLKSDVFSSKPVKTSEACFRLVIEANSQDPDIWVCILDPFRFLARFDEYLSKLVAAAKSMLISALSKGVAL